MKTQKQYVGVAKKLKEAIEAVVGGEVNLEVPELASHGDYSTNFALQSSEVVRTKKSPDGSSIGHRKAASSISGDNPPFSHAQNIKKQLEGNKGVMNLIDKVEVAGPGFINFWLKPDVLRDSLTDIENDKDSYGKVKTLTGKKIMVEFAHPNTHKEMHIGHMRTLIVGEALSRLLESAGAKVFRANYQGDIGPHVAKAIWGTKKLLEQRNSTWESEETKSLAEKAHLLGEGYVLGNKEYAENKAEIDELNKSLYLEMEGNEVYKRTRKWSLDYYAAFYERFGTKFDKLYFETDVAEKGKEIVESNVGTVFTKSEGAIIFAGSDYGLHDRVFVTSDGNPTYEGKEMALAPMQYSDFAFDTNIHVVANEQAGYFQVVIKALEQLFPEFKGKEYHLSMGMVNLVGAKISSRKGTIITVDGLLDEVKEHAAELVKDEVENKAEIAEKTTVGAVKYSVLATSATQNVEFDPKKSVNLSGNSGPYLQYTYARTQSVLAKAKAKGKVDLAKANEQEMALLRTFVHFPEVVAEAASMYAPNLVCNYLFDLAQKFNAFYAGEKIVGGDNEGLKLAITSATGQILANGLALLGIKAPKKM